VRQGWPDDSPLAQDDVRDVSAEEAMTTQGCDVASYQGMIDFDKLKNEVAFLFAKATEGTGFQDPTFNRNWTEAKRVGMTRGAYHFARPDLGLAADDEAAYFLAHVGSIYGDDMLALDYEVDWGGAVVAWCKEFLDVVRQETGVKPFIYLNLSLVRRHNWSSVISAGYPLWLAFYDSQPETLPPTPWPEVAIKQWTSAGNLSGIPGRVDLNTRFTEVEDDMALRDEFETFKRDTTATINEMKRVYNPLYHHVHLPGDITPSASSEPLIPPVEGALYSGSSADLKQVLWKYTDGTVHTWVDGKEAGS
jgi:GH25 family lysozyme M1 (1,4-beta-N-acetylmuramidase)